MRSGRKSDDDLELADYLGVLGRRWRIVVAVTVACLLGALAYVVAAPKSYTTATLVYVAPLGLNDGNQVAASRTGDSKVNLDTEAQLVTSGTVATMAAHLLRTNYPPGKLASLINITVPANSELLSIACTDSTAAGASDCANAFADAYLQNRSAKEKASISSQISSLQGKITALQKTIAVLDTEVTAQAPGTPARASDQNTANADRSQLHGLVTQVIALTTAGADNNGGHIVTKAPVPGRPSAPEKQIVVPSGLMFGLVLGLMLAFIWDRRDSRLHSASDVERLAGLPVLMNLPGRAFGRDISLPSPRSRTGRAFTELASDVAASLGEGSHVVLVTSATGGPAASYVAANLAATLARTHSEAVLVCANMRDSLAPGLFGLTGNGRGLAEVVAGRATVGEVARGPAGVPGLWVIPPGADPSLVEYHLQHDTAKALTTQLRRDARYVILEAQATQDGADTFALAEFADAAVLTVEANHTRRAQITECVKRLRRIRVTVLGAAVLPPISRQANPRPPQQSQTPLNAGSLTRTAGDEPPALSSTDTTRPHPADRPLSGH